MKRLTERVNDGLIMTKQDSGDNVSYYWIGMRKILKWLKNLLLMKT